MRVIAGEARGLPLSTPPNVRPTMDRVRGAIFSSLGDAVPGARVLDLFAGSGAMGIEALSRGAASAVFVDSNPRCAACVRANLRRAKLEASVQVMDALKFLELYAEGNF
ncbi:MAG: RsmD family RNA methyltransferase, partial [Terrimicrobiaceae bacterium]